MAQEKTRASSALTQADGGPGAAAEAVTRAGARRGPAADGEATPAEATTKKRPVKKTAAKKAADPKAGGKVPAAKAPARRRARTNAAAVEPTPEMIAEHAYLLWERGEAGDPTQHWLRAEAELRAA